MDYLDLEVCVNFRTGAKFKNYTMDYSEIKVCVSTTADGTAACVTAISQTFQKRHVTLFPII